MTEIPFIFPVSDKDKIPKGFSYPLGAQAITEALTGVPQRDKIKVHFYGHQYDRENLREISRGETPHVVFEAHYTANHGAPYAQSRHKPTGGPWWSLTVQPLLSVNRRNAKFQLLEHSLPAVRTWLMQERPETWLDSSHRIICEFDPVKQVVRVYKEDQ